MSTAPDEREATAPVDPTGERGLALAHLADMSPAQMGMVMATGIVSIACHSMAMPRVAHALFELNLALYAVLWLLTLMRLARHPRRFFGDMVDHVRGPAFFTTVAATGIVGSQFVVLERSRDVASALWVLAIVLWLGLTYTVFAGLTIQARKPTLERGIGGAWLLAVVATQSIAVLTAQLAAQATQPARLSMNFMALSMWLWGGMLYIWMMSLIFYRTLFFPLAPRDLSPPYWINMGAMAISTLAGSLLVLHATDAPFLLSLLPFLKGFTIFYWAAGTWWIPLLLALAVWRHVVKRFPLRYDPLYWAAVFPLGMYAAGTDEMAKAMALPLIGRLPPVFLAIALAAWSAAFAGLLWDLWRRVATRPR